MAIRFWKEHPAGSGPVWPTDEERATEFERRTDEAAQQLVDGSVYWFEPFGCEELHFARFAQQVILAKAFRRLSDGMQGKGQEGRTRQAPSDAIDG